MLFYKLRKKIQRDIHLLEIAFYLLMVILLVGGRSISKLQLIGPIFLYDTLLLGAFCWAALQHKKRQRFMFFELLFAIAFFYLAVSIILRPDKMSYVIRQFALFGYAFIAYIICITIMSRGTQGLLVRIQQLGRLSVLVQTAWSSYIITNGGISSLLGKYQGEYNYYSPLTVVGTLIFAADMLFLANGKGLKYALYFYSVFLCVTFGHSSAIVAVLCIAIFWVIKNYRRHIIPITLLCGLIVFVIFNTSEEVKDANATWRFMFWEEASEKIFVNNLAIVGEGFGVPYASQGLLYRFARELQSYGMLKEESKPYLVPMHNSFLTVFYHIGFLPGLLLLAPYIRGVRRMYSLGRETLFLLAALIALSTWSFFNVILELPHSSIGFWAVYFILYQKLYKEDVPKEAIKARNLYF
ncbi:hypothetical protein HGB07_06815 [Candidatus Roizmanbacteria bacterium]|nr:hypothetical protein [Candidatus Roizmanbacteria bacterium]